MAEAITKAGVISSLDEIIRQYFEDRIAASGVIDPSYRQLWESLYTLIRSGGKRLRPQMTIMAYEAFGGKKPDVLLPAAAAQELLHFSLLIHDDIIDRDYTRYNTLNIAGRYKMFYAQFLPDQADLTHFSHSAAMLAGNLMLSGAHELIANSDLDADKKMLAGQLLSSSVFEVAGGELLDTERSFTPYTPGDALKIARYKTAGYSFMTPLLTGARLAGADDAQALIVSDLGSSLGIAFQLADDLLGVFGDEKATGKSTTSDIIEGKRTYMIEQAVHTMTPAEKATFDSSFGRHDATPEAIETIKRLLVSTGAKAKTEQTMQEYAERAHDLLGQLQLDEIGRAAFDRLIRKVTEHD